MEIKLQDKLTMYIAVANQLARLPNDVVLPAGLTASIGSFNITLASIQSAAHQQVQSITGTATDKLAAKQTLAALINSTSAAIYAFASTVSNHALMEKAAYSPSELRRAKANELFSIGQSIYALATDNSAALANFGVSASSQAALKTGIDTFETAAPMPRNLRSEKATVTKNISALFKEANNILKNQIDKMMITLSASYPSIYSTYLSNRTVVDSGTRGTQIKGKIVSGAAPKGLPNVAVTYVEKGETVITKANGSFGFKGALPGAATLTFSAIGHTDLILPNIAIKQGQLNNQKITLTQK